MEDWRPWNTGLRCIFSSPSHFPLIVPESMLTWDAFTGSPSAKNCRAGNDGLGRSIVKSGHPARFAAFAVLSWSNAAESAPKLKQTMSSLGFVGALIENYANGERFDSAEYDDLWAKTWKVDVPVYFCILPGPHHAWPSRSWAYIPSLSASAWTRPGGDDTAMLGFTS